MNPKPKYTPGMLLRHKGDPSGFRVYLGKECHLRFVRVPTPDRGILTVLETYADEFYEAVPIDEEDQ